jgi:hypothetical protein
MVYSDHTNREYFITTKVFNQCQVRYAQEFASYDFYMSYQLGNTNRNPNGLSRHSEYHLRRGVRLRTMKISPLQEHHRLSIPDHMIRNMIMAACQ